MLLPCFQGQARGGRSPTPVPACPPWPPCAGHDPGRFLCVWVCYFPSAASGSVTPVSVSRWQGGRARRCGGSPPPWVWAVGIEGRRPRPAACLRPHAEPRTRPGWPLRAMHCRADHSPRITTPWPAFVSLVLNRKGAARPWVRWEPARLRLRHQCPRERSGRGEGVRTVAAEEGGRSGRSPE